MDRVAVVASAARSVRAGRSLHGLRTVRPRATPAGRRLDPGAAYGYGDRKHIGHWLGVDASARRTNASMNVLAMWLNTGPTTVPARAS
jgi:hypothetical protein